MKWIFWAILFDLFIGALVWAFIDDEEERFYKWYISADSRIAWFAQQLVLLCWPVGLYFWLRNKYNQIRRIN